MQPSTPTTAQPFNSKKGCNIVYTKTSPINGGGFLYVYSQNIDNNHTTLVLP